LNVKKWMNAINSSDKWELEAFDNNVLLGLGREGHKNRVYNYMASFEYSSPDEWENLNNIVYEGLILFDKIFGFPSRSFVAPCAIRGDHLDEVLRKNCVLFHQCGQQFIPSKSGSLKMINRFWGQRNKQGQIYWRRNSTFEPSRNPGFDWINSCLTEMKIAFRWHKPAVINSHRVNYMGSILPANRDNNLRLLKNLLQRALEKWPDIEFMSSDTLGDTILKGSE